jgi:hypothetical protein
MKRIVRPDVRADWTSPPKQGCKLELSAEIDGLVCRLVAIATDSTDGSVWVEFFLDGKIAQIPVQTLRRLLDSIPELEEWRDRVGAQDAE